MTNKIKLLKFKYGIEYAVEELAEQIIQFTKGTGADGGVVGLSGGVDSSTVAHLCKYAFDIYNKKNELDKLNLYGLIMPAKTNDSLDTNDGKKIAENLGIESKTILIEPIAKKFIESFPLIKDQYVIGNLYSEIRAVLLSRMAAIKNCRVMGTGNKDEDYVLGYFTKRGDGAVDNNILGNLSKRLVRELALYLNVPSNIIYKTPTAGLWFGQTDEGELGYSYEQAEIIKNGIDQGFSIEEVREMTNYDFGIIMNVLYRNKSTQHKRESPPIGKVTLDFI
jgi:NAD+ synthase